MSFLSSFTRCWLLQKIKTSFFPVSLSVFRNHGKFQVCSVSQQMTYVSYGRPDHINTEHCNHEHSCRKWFHRAKLFSFPVHSDVSRETGSSWSVGRFFPGPCFLACLAPQAGLLAVPQVIDKQIMETSKACLLTPHGDTTPFSCTLLWMPGVLAWLCTERNIFTLSCAPRVKKGVSTFTTAFELRVNIQALWAPYVTGTVWKGSQSKAKKKITLCASHTGCAASSQTVWLPEN